MNRLRLIAMACLLIPAAAEGATPTSPPVPGFGQVAAIPGAANLPDNHLRYRVLFTISKAAEHPDAINPSLDKAARFLNLLGSRGIKPPKGDVVVIVHGAATPLVLGDTAYRDRFGMDNPNIRLIRALTRAGARIHVCGQALHGQKIAPGSVAHEVLVDLSALTTIATLQLKGWVLMPE